jgi:hypothetical protein
MIRLLLAIASVELATPLIVTLAQRLLASHRGALQPLLCFRQCPEQAHIDAPILSNKLREFRRVSREIRICIDVSDALKVPTSLTSFTDHRVDFAQMQTARERHFQEQRVHVAVDASLICVDQKLECIEPGQIAGYLRVQVGRLLLHAKVVCHSEVTRCWDTVCSGGNTSTCEEDKYVAAAILSRWIRAPSPDAATLIRVTTSTSRSNSSRGMLATRIAILR